MCDAVSAIGAGISVFNYATGRRAAKKQERAISAAQEANREANAIQGEQVGQQALDEMSERAREALIERGRLSVIASDTGLSGVDAGRLERQSRFNEGYDWAHIEGNRVNALRQLGAASRAGERVADVYKSSIRTPSLIGTGLEIGGAVADYYRRTARPTTR